LIIAREKRLISRGDRTNRRHTVLTIVSVGDLYTGTNCRAQEIAISWSNRTIGRSRHRHRLCRCKRSNNHGNNEQRTLRTSTHLRLLFRSGRSRTIDAKAMRDM
jgi:hypothetical protein